MGFGLFGIANYYAFHAGRLLEFGSKNERSNYLAEQGGQIVHTVIVSDLIYTETNVGWKARKVNSSEVRLLKKEPVSEKEQQKYITYCRIVVKNNLPMLSFDEWRQLF